jgi:outer membrane protein
MKYAPESEAAMPDLYGGYMKIRKILVAAGMFAGACAFVADAAKADPSTDFHAGDKLIRLRALGVLPDVSTQDWTINGATNAASRALSADITSTVIPELDLTYFLTKNLSIEVIAGVVPVSIRGKSGLIAGQTVGEAWLLPPTATLQYHFGNIGGINPYVGGGVNYTAFFNQHASAGTLALNDLKIDGAWGAAVQGGFDMPLGKNLFLNVDVKKIFLNTDLKVSSPTTVVRTNVDIDPLIVGVGIGYRIGGSPAPLK